jgi:hypothetical protein
MISINYFDSSMKNLTYFLNGSQYFFRKIICIDTKWALLCLYAPQFCMHTWKAWKNYFIFEVEVSIFFKNYDMHRHKTIIFMLVFQYIKTTKQTKCPHWPQHVLSLLFIQNEHCYVCMLHSSVCIHEIT